MWAILIGHLQYACFRYLLPKTIFHKQFILIAINKSPKLGTILVFYLNSIASNLPSVEIPILLAVLLNKDFSHFAIE